ncbi:hypothetical protein AXG93_1052s1250 [Marchantia polymorpha subsp. ruderalis]|uniref:Coatomer subunit zeta n=1 Tax=Marchantia polymorpha subsp. ruderalis TaxID=1480154 RepID=A0A176VVI2_MARPO|nr:hypothetical protein AXG93_1052s1250 [Marchantia polymorpha subsp. ruderalis]
MNEVVTNRECEEDCGSAGARCQPGLVLVRREGEGQGEGTAAGRQFRAIGERYHGLPPDERLQWRSFLLKLTADNLKNARDDEQFVASHKAVFVVYAALGDICIFTVGKDEYDELALVEVLTAVTSSIRDVCKRAPSERVFLEKYGKVCLCLDEIVVQGRLEQTDKDRVRRLTRLKPLAEG